MQKTKVLYVLHNHPALFPGGAEAYALELYEALRDSHRVRAAARRAHRRRTSRPRAQSHPGAPFSAVGEDPNQYFLFTETDDFDFFTMTSRDKELYTQYFADFIKAHKPDIVHFQHTLFIGYDAGLGGPAPASRRADLLHAARVLPICHRDGQMLRTNGELCTHASPRRCNECFPRYRRRTSSCGSGSSSLHLDNVDMFLAPSQFLLERYVDWGIPRDRIRFEDYGRIRERPRRCLDAGPPASDAQPHRVLRPAEPLQGRGRAAAGDGAARRAAASTRTCGCTARTSSCSRKQFQRRVRGAAREDHQQARTT